MKYRIIYKNFYGKYNILITETVVIEDRKNSILSSREIYDAHIWVNDSVVKKSIIPENDNDIIFALNNTITEKELIDYFGMNKL